MQKMLVNICVSIYLIGTEILAEHMHQNWKSLPRCDCSPHLKKTQSKQGIVPRSRWSLKLNKYYFNIEALGFQTSIIKLL